MAFFEGDAFTPAQTEKASWLVKEAAWRVDITDFLLLRVGLLNLSETERDQIKKVATVIRTEQMEPSGQGEIFNLSDKIKPTGNFGIFISRKILKEVPLEEYLIASHEVLELKKANNVRVRERLENLGLGEEVGYELEAACDLGDSIRGEIALTEKMAKAAEISLASR